MREAAANFRRGGEIAQRHGIRLALEFNSRHPVINRLEVAREMVALANLPSCGLLLDAYHLDYEAPNPAQWSRPAEEVAREGVTAARALLAAAEAAFSRT